MTYVAVRCFIKKKIVHVNEIYYLAHIMSLFFRQCKGSVNVREDEVE